MTKSSEEFAKEICPIKKSTPSLSEQLKDLALNASLEKEQADKAEINALKGNLPETLSKQFCEAFHKHDYILWDAVVAWRDKIYQSNFFNSTKANHLTSMLKLIEHHVIDLCLDLKKADEAWVKEAKQKIDDILQWSVSTRTIRKSCLNLFYKFIKTEFNHETQPYLSHLKPNVTKHVLSSVQDKALTAHISPEALCSEVGKLNKRDGFIVWVMLHSKQPLEAVLDLRKEDLRVSDVGRAYLDFPNVCEYIPEHITARISELCKNSKAYLFETAKGKRISRIQIMRNLKQAGRNIGLEFDLTPKVLRGYVNAYMTEDKREELEKALSA